VHYELGQVHSLEERIAIVEWHRNWGRGVQTRIKPLPPAPALHMPRKWRIGFLSSDLRNHPVTYFCMPLLEHMIVIGSRFSAIPSMKANAM
jgi:hypothetical protein